MAYCSRCGGALEQAARFCAGCGVPVESPSVPRAPDTRLRQQALAWFCAIGAVLIALNGLRWLVSSQATPTLSTTNQTTKAPGDGAANRVRLRNAFGDVYFTECAPTSEALVAALAKDFPKLNCSDGVMTSGLGLLCVSKGKGSYAFESLAFSFAVGAGNQICVETVSNEQDVIWQGKGRWGRD